VRSRTLDLARRLLASDLARYLLRIENGPTERHHSVGPSLVYLPVSPDRLGFSHPRLPFGTLI